MAKFTLTYNTVKESEFYTHSVAIEAETLNRAWMEVLDWLDCERKFLPVQFLSLTANPGPLAVLPRTL